MSRFAIIGGALRSALRLPGRASASSNEDNEAAVANLPFFPDHPSEHFEPEYLPRLRIVPAVRSRSKDQPVEKPDFVAGLIDLAESVDATRGVPAGSENMCRQWY